MLVREGVVIRPFNMMTNTNQVVDKVGADVFICPRCLVELKTERGLANHMAKTCPVLRAAAPDPRFEEILGDFHAEVKKAKTSEFVSQASARAFYELTCEYELKRDALKDGLASYRTGLAETPSMLEFCAQMEERITEVQSLINERMDDPLYAKGKRIAGIVAAEESKRRQEKDEEISSFNTQHYNQAMEPVNEWFGNLKTQFAALLMGESWVHNVKWVPNPDKKGKRMPVDDPYPFVRWLDREVSNAFREIAPDEMWQLKDWGNYRMVLEAVLPKALENLGFSTSEKAFSLKYKQKDDDGNIYVEEEVLEMAPPNYVDGVIRAMNQLHPRLAKCRNLGQRVRVMEDSQYWGEPKTVLTVGGKTISQKQLDKLSEGSWMAHALQSKLASSPDDPKGEEGVRRGKNRR